MDKIMLRFDDRLIEEFKEINKTMKELKEVLSNIEDKFKTMDKIMIEIEYLKKRDDEISSTLIKLDRQVNSRRPLY